MTDIPFGNPGRAEDAFEAFTQRDLLLSDTPAFFTEDMTLAASQDIALYEVVGLDGDGNIIPAVLDTGTPANDVQAIGLAAGAITSGVGENPTIQVIRGGHFNADMLVWEAGFATDAQKIAAFRGAPTPTQIVIGFNKYHKA